MPRRDLTFRLLGEDKSASQALDNVGRKADGLGGKLRGFSGIAAKAFGGFALAAGGAAVAGGTLGIKTAASMEQARIAFETMLGSGKKADSFLKDLSAFAAKTPFEFPELQTAASSLISAGVEAKNVIPIMTSLGNATSGMGTGSEGIKRATIALQQMNAAGRITGEDLNQLRDAGIPVFDLLAAATGKSKEAVAALAQKGKLGKKELGQLMTALQKGKGLERFAGLMDKQSRSLTGLWATFKDTLGMGLARLMQRAVPLFKRGLDTMSRAMSGLFGWMERNLPRAIEKVVRTFRPLGQGLRAFFDGITGNAKSSRDGIVGVVQTIGEKVRGAFDWVADVGPRVAGALAGVVGQITTAVAPIVAGIGSTLQAGLDRLKPNVGPLAEKLRAGFTQAADRMIGGLKTAIETGDWQPIGVAIGEAIRKALSGTGGIVSALGRWASEVDWLGVGLTIGKKAIPFAIGLVAGLATGLLSADTVNSVKDHFTELLIAAVAVVPVGRVAGLLAKVLAKIPVLRAFTPMFRGLEKAGGFVEKWGGKLAKRAAKIAGGFVIGFFRGMGNWIPSMRRFADELDVLPIRISEWGDKLRRAARAAVDKLTGGFREGASRARGQISGALGEVTGAVLVTLRGMGADLFRTGAWAIRQLAGGIRSVLGGLLANLKQIPGRIVGVFAGAATLLFSVGTALITGLWDGISSKTGWLKEKVAGVAEAIPGTFKKILGISSPSRVMAGYGRDVVMGLTVGMTKMRAKAAAAAAALAKTVREQYQAGLAKRNEFIRGAREGLLGQAPLLGENLSSFRDIKLNLADKLKQMRVFAQSISAVVHKGLHGSLVQQLIDAGPEQGGAAARALAGSTPGQLRDLNRIQSGIFQAATFAGSRAERAINGPITINIHDARDPAAVARAVRTELQRLAARGTNVVFA